MSIREFESRLDRRAGEDALFKALRRLSHQPEALKSIARETKAAADWQPWPKAG